MAGRRVSADGFRPFFLRVARDVLRQPLSPERRRGTGLIYWSDDSDLMALRVGAWKARFAVQNAKGVEAWQLPFIEFPPRQKPSSFSIDAVMEKAQQAKGQLEGATGGGPK